MAMCTRHQHDPICGRRQIPGEIVFPSCVSSEAVAMGYVIPPISLFRKGVSCLTTKAIGFLRHLP